MDDHKGLKSETFEYFTLFFFHVFGEEGGEYKYIGAMLGDRTETHPPGVLGPCPPAWAAITSPITRQYHPSTPTNNALHFIHIFKELYYL